MKPQKGISPLTILRVAVLLAGAALFFSCQEGLDEVPGFEIDEYPALTVRNLNSTQTDSGKVQFIMKAPILHHYSRAVDEPYTHFPEGFEVTFYDGNPNPVAFVSARKAKHFEEKQLWELRERVELHNTANNELLETELLYWDEEKELIYTDRFVRITGPDRRVEGYNFSSDQRFAHWRIERGTATIYLRDR